MVYCLLLLTLFILSVLFDIFKIKYRIIGKIFMYVSFVSIAGFRYKTGFDWDDYTKVFNAIENGVTKINFEIGYIYLNALFSTIFRNYYVMQLFIAIICSYILFDFIFKNSKFPFFSLFLYFNYFYLILDMGMIRQHIAITILLLSYNYIKKKEQLKFVISVLTASLFHKTAIVWFLTALFPRIKGSLKVKFIFVFMFIGTQIYSRNIVQKILEFYLKLNVGIWTEKIKNYLQQEARYGEIGTGLGFVLYFVITIICIVYNRKLTRDIFKKYYVENIIFLSIILRITSINFPIISRMNLYFELYLIIFYPILLDLRKDKISKLILISLFGVYFLRPWYEYYKDGAFVRVIPYYSIFNKVEDIRRKQIEEGF